MRRAVVASVVLFTGLALAVLVVVVGAATASGTADKPQCASSKPAVPSSALPAGAAAPSITLAPATPVLEQDGSSWAATVTVGYSGPALTQKLTFELVVTSPVLPSSTCWPVTSAPAPAPGSAEPLTVSFPSTFGVVPSAAELVVETSPPSPAAAPVIVGLVIVRSIGSGQEVGWPIGTGLIGVFLFLVCLIWLFALGESKPTAKSTWSFKDSWATNITAAGAFVGTVISGTGAVTSVFPGVPLYRFSILFAVCGGVVLFAPLVAGLGTQQRQDPHGDGTTIGYSQFWLLFAQGLTLMAVAGELTSMALLVSWSSASSAVQDGLIAALVLAGIAVLAYAVTATGSLYDSPSARRDGAGTAVAQGMQVAAPDKTSVRQRLREHVLSARFSAHAERSAAL